MDLLPPELKNRDRTDYILLTNHSNNLPGLRDCSLLLLQILFQPASIVQIEFLVGTGMSEAGNPCGTRLAAERGRPARKIRLQAMIFDCGVFLVQVAGGTPALRTA